LRKKKRHFQRKKHISKTGKMAAKNEGKKWLHNIREITQHFKTTDEYEKLIELVKEEKDNFEKHLILEKVSKLQLGNKWIVSEKRLDRRWIKRFDVIEFQKKIFVKLRACGKHMDSIWYDSPVNPKEVELGEEGYFYNATYPYLDFSNVKTFFNKEYLQKFRDEDWDSDYDNLDDPTFDTIIPIDVFIYLPGIESFNPRNLYFCFNGNDNTTDWFLLEKASQEEKIYIRKVLPDGSIEERDESNLLEFEFERGLIRSDNFFVFKTKPISVIVTKMLLDG